MCKIVEKDNSRYVQVCSKGATKGNGQLVAVPANYELTDGHVPVSHLEFKRVGKGRGYALFLKYEQESMNFGFGRW